MKRYVTLAIALLALTFAACATTTSGPTDPILSQFVPNTLNDNAAILTDFAISDCNGGAATEYNANMLICLNPAAEVTTIVNNIPGNAFMTPATESTVLTMLITGKCGVGGYTPALPPTVTPGPESVCLKPPLTPPAPVAGAPKQHSYRTHHKN